MATVSALRSSCKAAEFGRGLEGLRTRVTSETKASGVKELDAMLGGGFPCGSLVELCGAGSSGRTSLSLALLAQATKRQEACAFVDVSDSLDPASAAAAGVDLERLLWIRCGSEGDDEFSRRFSSSSPRSKSPRSEQNDEKNGASDSKSPAAKEAKGSHGWRHPRDQIRGVETAIPSLLSARPAAAENKLISVVARCAGEQVEADRQLPRRGDNVRRRLPAAENVCQQHQQPGAIRSSISCAKPWKRLEQAIKTTDLLLHAGGWGMVVFDMGNVSWLEARRIELSTWFRFRRAVENTPTILLLVEEESCAKSCASLVLACRRRGENWDCAAPPQAARGGRTFQGFEVEGEVLRSRTGLQPGDSARWMTNTISNDSF